MRRTLLAALVGLAGSCGQARPPAPEAPARATSARSVADVGEAAARNPPPPTQPATVEERLGEVHARAGRGRPAVSELHQGTLETGQTRDFSLNLRGGRCYTIIAVGAASVSDLDVFLYDPNGWLVAWDRARDPTPLVSTCLSLAGAYRLRVKMYSGSGEYALQVFAERAMRDPNPPDSLVDLPLSPPEDADAPDSPSP